MNQSANFLQMISCLSPKRSKQKAENWIAQNYYAKKAFLKGIFISLFFPTIVLIASPPSEDWETYQSKVLKEQPEFPGWCPTKKAKDIMDVVFTNHPQLCVELGVFGGSSFFPLAAALAFTGQGIAYAIDPWSNDACLEGYEESDEKHNNYWGSVNLEKVMDKFVVGMRKNALDSYYHLMRMSSAEANPHFEDDSIDFLHIDGNHSEESAIFDVKNWLPKVKKGGIVCFDDAWWDSTQEAVSLLLKECDLLEELSSSWKQYIFLKKR